MTVEPKPPPPAPRGRRPVARLAEALASAQAIARDEEYDRGPVACLDRRMAHLRRPRPTPRPQRCSSACAAFRATIL